jgi:hypothetical protein
VVSGGARLDQNGKHLISAEAVLAPLAAGEYVLELSVAKDGKTDVLSYGFRLVP